MVLGDTRADGFFWLDADDANRSIYAFVRQAADQPRIAVVANMTPVMQVGYRLGLPSQGHWHEVLNTDAGDYGGAGRGNMGSVSTEPIPAQGQSQSAAIVLPPLSVLVFRETKGE